MPAAGVFDTGSTPESRRAIEVKKETILRTDGLLDNEVAVYAQSFRLGDRFAIELRGDVFNAFDNQTGYAIQPNVHVAAYGQPTAYYNPRRFQAGVRLLF